MGKYLKDLLNNYQFQDERFNPRNVKEDMLSSKQTGEEISISGLSVGGVKLPYDRQYSLLTQNIAEIYGADAPRILLRGVVDTKKATKKILNRAGKIISFGSDSALGSFVRNSLTGLVGANQPSDTISGNSTGTGLYSDMYNARVNNSQNPITGLLTQFKTPSQFKAAVGDISNGKVKIGGAVVDELTNLSFKGLGWAAAKIGLGKQDAGKTKSLSQTLKDSTNSNSTGRTKFPSFFAEIKANFSKSKIIPTGIITGQDQFAKLANFPTMYDDSPVKTGLTLDGVARNVRTSTGLADNYNDYLTKNPIEDFRKSGIFSPYGNGDTIDAESGDRLKTKGDLGFNTNNETFGPRSQTFSAGLGINEGYSLKDAILTNQRTKLEGFLIIKDGNEGVYKIPDIISNGRPTRFFTSKAINDDGSPNVNFFGGYKNRREMDRPGDHRLKSALALKSTLSDNQDAGNDLIKIRFGYGGKYTHLLSNITGFTDTPTISWGEAKPIGSPYKFYFYESFEREVSFKTQIYASSQEELPLVWKKANAIMALTKGNAKGVAGIAGKICTLRIGDMFDCNFGFITSCTLTVPDISPWEIKDGSQLPFVCEMDISYKVIQSTSESDFYGAISIIGNKTPKNPAYTFEDFPNIGELPPPNDFSSIPRPQLNTVDLVKLPNPTRTKLFGNRTALQAENDINQTNAAESYLNSTRNTAETRAFGEETALISAQDINQTNAAAAYLDRTRNTDESRAFGEEAARIAELESNLNPNP